MSNFYIMGIFCGAAVALLIALLIRQRAGECHYDEMQLKLRGDGYKLGFMTVICCTLLYAFFSEWTDYMIFSTGFAMLVITFIGILVFGVFCIMKEAFFSVGDNGKKYLLICFLVAAFNLFLAVDRMKQGDFLINGQVTIESGGNLLITVFACTMIVALVVKMIGQGNNNEES